MESESMEPPQKIKLHIKYAYIEPITHHPQSCGEAKNIIPFRNEIGTNLVTLGVIMEWTPLNVLSFGLFVASLLLFLRKKGNKSRCRLPPGPPGWPVFGNLFNIGQQPHRTMTILREKYGPIIWLRLGSIDTMVLNSAKVATEFFKNHDLEFAERTVTDIMRVRGYANGSVALAPYGSYWRVMRRLVTVDMLVTKRLVESAPVRRKCMDDMMTWIAEAAQAACNNQDGIHVARYVFFMTFNLLGNLMLSKDMFDPNSKVGSEFFEAMTGLMEWAGHPNVAELFPWLRKLDPQGLRRRMERDMGKALEIASGFVTEKMKEREMGVKKRDFLDVLMEFRGNGRDEPDMIPEKELKVFILVRQKLIFDIDFVFISFLVKLFTGKIK